MFSALRQFAERTVSSRSSTGRSRIGSIGGDFGGGSAGPGPVSLMSAKTCSWSTRMRAACLIASSGSMMPFVSISMISLSRSVRCSTRALDLVAHPLHRRERGVEDDLADPFRFLGDHAQVPGLIAATALDLDRHLE